GPITTPPEYCISTLFGPRPEIASSAYCLPVRHTVATRMIDADPITMPSIVSRNRVLLARKLSKASESVSRNAIVERALRRMLSKLRAAGRRLLRLGGVVIGLGTPVWVAMQLAQLNFRCF